MLWYIVFTNKEAKPIIQECLDGCSAGRVHALVVAGQTKECAVTQHRLIENVGDAGWQLLQEEESVQETQPHCTTEIVRPQQKTLIQTVLLNNVNFPKCDTKLSY